MIMKRIVLAATTAVMLAAPTGVSAQSIELGPNGLRVNPPEVERRYDDRDVIVQEEISPREAAAIAQDAGIDEVDQVVRRRNSYRVTGIDRGGQDLQVTVDRYSGEVIGRRRI
ncbi:PepSY domain-containing protein [Chthonobacter albigriseus]|uniref:PepSY domain-containing protein n=1 Tax=Chthonobacter albigriseus TaxID=1683161 RepID=UPI001FCE74F8|nr:PepSY domain-containing protein [Chthonobacter albigriseus]